MKSKQQKSEELKKLKDKLPKSKITVFTSFSSSTHSTSSGRASSGQVKAGEKGLSVAQMTELKRLLRAIKSEYFVTKKTLMNLALKEKKYDGLDVFSMEGSVGLVLGLVEGSSAKPGIAVDEDPYVIAKKVYEFSRKNPALHFWGALMDGKFMDKEGFLEIAKMPSKEVLIGRLLGMLTYPMRGLAVVLSEVAKKQAI